MAIIPVRTYSELITYKTFEERFDYLVLGGQVGSATFGFDRWINQQFYTSSQWRHIRNQVILRDEVVLRQGPLFVYAFVL